MTVVVGKGVLKARKQRGEGNVSPAFQHTNDFIRGMSEKELSVVHVILHWGQE